MATIEAARQEQYEKAKKLGEMRKSGIPLTSKSSSKPCVLSPKSRAGININFLSKIKFK